MVGLCAFLSVLIAILMFQDQLTGRPSLYWRVRLAFMAGTLLFLGFCANVRSYRSCRSSHSFRRCVRISSGRCFWSIR